MYNKLIIITILLAFFASTASLSAQDAHPPREVGLQFGFIDFGGTNTFGAFFKKQLRENVYRRISLSGSLNTVIINDNYNLSFSAGGSIGREKRKALDSKLVFYQGPEFGGSFGIATVNGDNTDFTVGARFNWVVGLQHSFNTLWAINIEAAPGVGLNVNVPEVGDPRVLLNANVSNRVAIGLVRKF